MQKSLHLKLPCETRVIWDTNNVFCKKGLLTFEMKKYFVFLENLRTYKSFHC